MVNRKRQREECSSEDYDQHEAKQICLDHNDASIVSPSSSPSSPPQQCKAPLILPEELYYTIFQFLDAQQLDLKRRVCTAFNKVAQDNNLWMALTTRRFHPYSFDPRLYFFNFRNCYIDLHFRRITYLTHFTTLNSLTHVHLQIELLVKLLFNLKKPRKIHSCCVYR